VRSGTDWLTRQEQEELNKLAMKDFGRRQVHWRWRSCRGLDVYNNVHKLWDLQSSTCIYFWNQESTARGSTKQHSTQNNTRHTQRQTLSSRVTQARLVEIEESGYCSWDDWQARTGSTTSWLERNYEAMHPKWTRGSGRDVVSRSVRNIKHMKNRQLLNISGWWSLQTQGSIR